MEAATGAANSSQLSSLDSSPDTCQVHSKSVAETTPQMCHSNPKKRKFNEYTIGMLQNMLHPREELELDDFADICSSTPQASSTLNESGLVRQFQNVNIERNYFFLDGCDGPATKHLKTNDCERLVTPPSTPESHLRVFDRTPKKAGIFSRASSACSVPSPLKEQHDILYPTLKPLNPLRKPLTPQKFLEKIDIDCKPVRKLVVEPCSSDRLLLNRILSNQVVMDKVFSYVSNGDLFRVSKVSRDFRDALYRSSKAKRRFELFEECHKKNKENYKITPPSSPETQALFPVGSFSPNSRKFADFVETGSHLNSTQSLTKCPKCSRPSVVERGIAQCQEVNSCGYIFCQKCDSFSFNPEEFYDKCQGLQLNYSAMKRQRRFDDLTNCSLDFNLSSVLNSTAAEPQNFSSGYFSGYESSHTPLSVKRNLNSSFSSNERRSLSKTQKALFESNQSLSFTKVKETQKALGNVIPVVKSDTIRRRIEVIEPSSPPKVKTYAVCSKESRRNLKRLTR